MKQIKRIGILLLACVLVSSGAYALGLLNFNGSETASKGITITEEEYALLQKYKRLEEIKDVIDYAFLWEYDEDKLMEGAAQGMLRALDDAYSFYYTPDQMSNEQEKMVGEYGGMGFEVYTNLKDDTITISRVFYGGPAQEAGIQPFDKIIAVDGKEMRAGDLAEAVSIMRGEPGGEVMLTILRGEEIFEVTLVRAIVQDQVIQHEMLDDEIGYIRIYYFEGKLMEQFEKARDELIEQGAKALVLDLRNNPGGLANLAVDLVDAFVGEDDVIMQTEDKYGRRLPTYARAGAWDIPVAILQSGTSASASEIVAVALQENDVAIVVGTQSYGKGIMQVVYPFPSDGAGMQITSDYWLSPKGNNLHEKGVTPDIEIELNEDAVDELYYIIKEKDNQMQAAVEALHERIGAQEE